MSGRQYTRGMRLWPVIYPVLFYFAVCQILDMVQQILPFTAGLDAVMRQGVDTLGGLAALYVYEHQKEKCQRELTGVRHADRRKLACSIVDFLKGARPGEEGHSMKAGRETYMSSDGSKSVDSSKTGGRIAAGCLAAAIMLGCGSFALNNLIAMTDLMQRSSGYQFVQKSFYSSGLFWEIAVLCVLTPVTEELLYRSIVFSELRGWLGRWGAIFGSALLFGAMHMNLVQMIYAFGLGFLLGILMERYGDVRIAMCGHIAANLLSVLRSEMGLLTGLEKGSAAFWAATTGTLFIALALTAWCAKKMPAVDGAQNL